MANLHIVCLTPPVPFPCMVMEGRETIAILHTQHALDLFRIGCEGSAVKLDDQRRKHVPPPAPFAAPAAPPLRAPTGDFYIKAAGEGWSVYESKDLSMDQQPYFRIRTVWGIVLLRGALEALRLSLWDEDAARFIVGPFPAMPACPPPAAATGWGK